MNQRKAFEDTLTRLREIGYDIMGNESEGIDYDHFEDMLRRIKAADAEGTPFSEAKIGRWLGWVQGAAAAGSCGGFSLDDAKKINQRWAD
jgi:hypothetical protein